MELFFFLQLFVVVVQFLGRAHVHREKLSKQQRNQIVFLFNKFEHQQVKMNRGYFSFQNHQQQTKRVKTWPPKKREPDVNERFCLNRSISTAEK